MIARHRTRLVYCSLIVTLLAADQALAQQKPPENTSPALAARFLPDEALVAIELREGDTLLNRFRELAEERDFFEADAYVKLENNPQFIQARVALAGLAATAGVDPWKAAGAVLGRNAAIGIWPGTEKKPRILISIELREPQLFDRILNTVHAMAGLTRNGAPDESRSAEIDGVRVFSANAELHHCRIQNALLLSNDRALLSKAISLGKSGKACLANSEHYRKAVAGLPKDAIAWAVADLKMLRALIPEGEARDGPRANPLGGFLFGAWWQTLFSSENGVVWIEAHDRALQMNASVSTREPLPHAYRGFLPTNATKFDWAANKLPHFASELRICRNWADLIGEREALLTTAAASDVVNFTSTMSTLFNGMDFLNDVLPQIDSPLRLIAVRQNFDQRDVIPTPKLPAFALIAPLKADTLKEFTQRFNSASQTALTLVNYGLTQEGKTSYLIDVDRYKGVKLLVTEFSGPPASGGMKMDAPEMKSEGMAETKAATPRNVGNDAQSKPAKITGAPPTYNFLPASAVVGEQYVFATSRELLQDVIDAIQAGDKAAKKAGEIADSWIVDGRTLAAILRDNRDEMITGRMLAENESRETAGATIDLILQLVDQIGGVRVVSQTGDREMRATVEITLAEKKRD